jgi:hypothetical protein
MTEVPPQNKNRRAQVRAERGERKNGVLGLAASRAIRPVDSFYSLHAFRALNPFYAFGTLRALHTFGAFDTLNLLHAFGTLHGFASCGAIRASRPRGFPVGRRVPLLRLLGGFCRVFVRETNFVFSHTINGILQSLVIRLFIQVLAQAL